MVARQKFWGNNFMLTAVLTDKYLMSAEQGPTPAMHLLQAMTQGSLS